MGLRGANDSPSGSWRANGRADFRRGRSAAPMSGEAGDPRVFPSRELTMDPPTLGPVIAAGDENESPASEFRSVVRKSALLNVVIVLTALPVLVAAGGPRAVVPTLAIMAGITLMIWTATFTVFSCISIGRLLWTTFSAGTRRKPPLPARDVGLGDRWLDGPG
jgi:hypothetical protein